MMKELELHDEVITEVMIELAEAYWPGITILPEPPKLEPIQGGRCSRIASAAFHASLK